MDFEHNGYIYQPRMQHLSVSIQPGMEGMYIHKDCFQGKKIAVLTSGGDSQGMNSVLRAVVRMGIYCGCSVYLIKEGFQGLVAGKDYIVEATWASVSNILQLGGTIIGSTECEEFLTRDGRKLSAKNLIIAGITNLVIIGGDGSLTGANQFKTEWSELIEELVKDGQISTSEYLSSVSLNVVGVVASVDNDVCGTDMTIGTDSALHRIIEACDAITSTAHSHQRCFILEIMGRQCGYLALVTALASEAEWVFIPESPPDEGWEEKLCEKLDRNKHNGQRVNIIVISEGAIDLHGKPITSSMVQQIITSKLNFDSRVTVLGHVQRGGNPSAFDRILGIRMGAEAVLALMDGDKNPELESCIISLHGNQIVRVPLKTCVEKTKAIEEALRIQNFQRAVNLRGRSFVNNLNAYKNLSKSSPPKSLEKNSKKIAILNVGAPACGTNAVVRSFTRFMISKGFDVIGVHEGFQGFVKGDYETLDWNKVKGWVGIGGSILGIRRETPQNVGMKLISKIIDRVQISGMLIIGGFEAYTSLLQMYKARNTYPNLNMPMLCVPATISNNVPGTDFSLGADTSLNEITEIVDKIKQSAVGTKRRVFIVETHGGHCGYLATMSGIAGGADAAYIHEEEFGIDELRADVTHLKAKIADKVQRGLILINEKANKNYSTQFVHRLFEEEGKGIFDARMNVPGHLQQGGNPSPFDRNMGFKMGSKASDWFTQQFEEPEKHPNSCLLGIQRWEHKFTPVWELEPMSDFKHRLPCEQWWLNLRPLLRIMAKHESLYTSESIMTGLTKPFH